MSVKRGEKAAHTIYVSLSAINDGVSRDKILFATDELLVALDFDGDKPIGVTINSVSFDRFTHVCACEACTERLFVEDQKLSYGKEQDES